MSSPIRVDIFVEDAAHEEFVKCMFMRLAREAGQTVSMQVRSARGGHGKALTELRKYQRLVLDDIPSAPRVTAPDLLVVAIDANCKGWNEAAKGIRGCIDKRMKGREIVACPDPHVERWYLADPDSFVKVVGSRPVLGRKKCRRDYYKNILAKAIEEAGHPSTLGGIEFAREIVEAMDLYRAAQADRSLGLFLRDASLGLK